MNILLSSAGRRSYLIKYFKEAIGESGQVYAGNSEIRSAAFPYADQCIVTPPIYSDCYIPFLMDYCKKNSISLIVPVFDLDVAVLSQYKEQFLQNGIFVLAADAETVHICNDKWETYYFCKKHGVPVPHTFLEISEVKTAIDSGTITFPLIIKPRWGTGSLNMFEADNQDELQILLEKCKNNLQKSYLKYESIQDMDNSVIIQEKMAGIEYGVDIINDLNRNFCCSVVKRKYTMRAGETDCAEIESNEKLEQLSKIIGSKLGHIGNLDVDFFIMNGKPFLLEMNARFGGGYPFSHIAGINLPAAIIKWIKGENLADELTIKYPDIVICKDISFVDLSENMKVAL